MPRIQAATVAEHRAQQRRAILDAARAYLAEEGHAPSLAEVGARANLARSSVYEYFGSRDELLAGVVGDVFPAWTGQVVRAIESATTPGEQVWAYVQSNMRLFAGSEQAVARALTEVVDPALLAEPLKQFHESLQKPLVAALRAHGEPRPQLMADVIGSMLVRASQDMWSPNRRTSQRRLRDATRLLSDLLWPYLGIEQGRQDAATT